MNDPYTVELHEILLRVAGWLADDVLASARSRLAEGRNGEVARMLTFAGARTVLPLQDDDLDLLGDLLDDEEVDRDLLETIELAPEFPPVLWRFSETPPVDDGADAPGEDDTALTAALAEGDLVSAITDEPGARGLWCAWRTPVDDAPYPPPRPVYVVEIDHDHEDAADPADLAGRLQEKLSAAGMRDPQVEVLSVGEETPSYQRAARGRGKLLWAAEPEPEISVVRIFDAVDPETGPSFAPDRPRVTDEDERKDILDYLREGTELLVTSGTLDDVVEPERGSVVPMNFRTDGVWVWTDTVTYYLEEHHLAPDPDLLEHIRAVDGSPARPDSVALGRAMQALRPSEESQPVWTSAPA
jgi:hypothetical protein